jgi:hypothetical protein
LLKFEYYNKLSFLQFLQPNTADKTALNKTNSSKCLRHRVVINNVKTVACANEAREFTGDADELTGYRALCFLKERKKRELSLF